MNLASGIKLGRYEIRSKIGEGGMGEVYPAEDTRLHRKVALKILPSGLSVPFQLTAVTSQRLVMSVTVARCMQ